MIEKDKQITFVKFDKDSYKRDSMELFLYGIIKTYENKAGFTTISVKQLLEYTDSGRSLVSMVKQSLTNLIEEQLIEVYDAIDFQNNVAINNVKSSDMLYIKVKEMVSVKDQFIQVFTDEILRFMSIKMKGKKAAIFKQFLYIMKYVNQGEGYRKISFPNIETISKDTGASDRSVKNYTKTMEENGLLYSNILIIEKEKLKKIYSRTQYSQDVDDAIAECILTNTKKISTNKSKIQKNSTDDVQKEKEGNITMKKPELLFGLDKHIRETYEKYGGQFNDQALNKLLKYQEKHGGEVMVKALHIAMDGIIGLKNPTGFMLKRLADGVISDAEYHIKRTKERLERDEKSNSQVPSFDYIKALKESRRKEKEKEEIEKEKSSLIWKKEGYSSPQDYDKAKKDESMREFLDSLKMG